MTIYPGVWSNGQLAARIGWCGTWSGAAVGALTGAGLLLALRRVDPPVAGDLSDLVSRTIVAIIIGAVLGGVVGTLWGLAAAVVTLRRCARVDHADVEPTGVALTALLVVPPLHVAVVGLDSGSWLGLAVALATGLLGAGPLFLGVRRQVRRELLQDLAVRR